MFYNQDLAANSASTPNPHPYLPEYLLGEPTYSSSPVQSNQSRNLSILTTSPWPNISGSACQSPAVIQTPRRSRNTVDKQGGPPIHGLYDQQHQPSFSTLSDTPSIQANQDTYMSSPIKSRDSSILTNKSLLFQSNSSPAQLDPFYTQGEFLKHDEELDATWVTVFGFPHSAVSYILQQFAQYGNVLQHVVSGGNNWVHLHYQSKIQAKKALGKNGKILCGNMMIGVQPCIDKTVMKEASKENYLSESTLSFNTSSKTNSVLDQSGSNMLSGMRPLTHAYRVAANTNEVLQSSPILQKKSGVSKAMEYVFGW